jgi:hypothetical protein
LGWLFMTPMEVFTMPKPKRRIVTAKIYEDTRDRLLAIKDRLGLASLAVAADRVVKEMESK